MERTLYNTPPVAKLVAYTSLSRPIIEYASSLWDPSYKKDGNRLEMVQH